LSDPQEPESPSPGGTQISGIAIEDELKKSYLDYAMSVIVQRALPDVRDGLKPVHRRILFSMHENGYDWNKAYRKSARVVGDVIGKYHPHGDQSIYDALVRMAQEFSMSAPLIDGQGNFGSVDGDPPAAMRYTEVRRSKIAHLLTEDIEKDTIEFKDNYDGTEKEPVVLPARFPNILINGSSGIAVGMATNVPPHNLGEVISACLAYIEDPSINLEALTEIVPGPDFPTGGLLIGKQAARAALARGRGSILMRARCHIEELRKDREAIIVTELPYQVNKARMQEKIAEMMREKRIDGIADIRDESDRHGMRVVIELRRDASSEVVLNQLYRSSGIDEPENDDRRVCRVPRGGRHQADAVRSFEGARPRARSGRSGGRCRQYRRRDRADPCGSRRGYRSRSADGARLAGPRCRAPRSADR
jgi:DNA gyrase subunit A